MAEIVNRYTGAPGTGGIVVQGRDIHLTVRPPAPPRVAEMLPHAPYDFVNRDEQRERLGSLFESPHDGPTPLVIAVTGPAGVGKTALVSYVLPDWLGRFPGGRFYARLSGRNSDEARDSLDVLGNFLSQMGIPTTEMPSDLSGRGARFRSETSAEPCLLLLDDVVTAGQVATLLPGHPGSVVVVTSRRMLGGLSSAPYPAKCLRLGGLRAEACTELFRHIVAEHAADEPSDAQRQWDAALEDAVIRACDGRPGAVRIAAGRAVDPLDGGIRSLVDRLVAGRTALEELSVSDDLSMRLLFDDACRALDAPTARTLRALGWYPAPHFPDELVVRLGGGGEAGKRALWRLLETHLVERGPDGRCRMIGMLHSYARERAEQEGTPAERAEAMREMADALLVRAAAVEYRVSPRWRWGAVFAEPARLAAWFEDERQALAAFDADETAAVAVVDHCFAAGQYDMVCQLVEALRGYWFRRKHHTPWIAAGEKAVIAAERLGLPLVLARMRYELAFAYLDRGTEADLETAGHHYAAARDAARTAGHARTLSSALEGLAQVATRQERPVQAITLLEEALAALADVDHPRGRALLRYHLGPAYSSAHEHQKAADTLLGARELFARLPDPAVPGQLAPDRYNEARALTRYGAARIEADRPDEAVREMAGILELFAGLDSLKEEGDALLVRGDAHAACGAAEAARSDWQGALDRYERVRSERAAEARQRLGDGGGDGLGGGGSAVTGHDAE